MSQRFLSAGVALSAICTSTIALAGGLERSVTNISPLFEDGRYLEVSAVFAFPNLDGQDGTIPPGFLGPFEVPITGNTGDLLDTFALFGGAYKADINEKLSYAFILNQPYGANTTYPVASAPLPDVTAIYNGSSASVSSAYPSSTSYTWASSTTAARKDSAG